MKQWLRKLLPLAVVAAVLLGVAAILAGRWLEQALSAEGVAARLGSAIGREVWIGSLEVHVTPSLGVRFEDVSVGSEADLDVVEVAPRILPLLLGRVEPARVLVEGARVRLVRGPDGSIGFGGTKEGPTSSEDLGAVPEIQLEDARIELVDLSLGADPVETTLRLESFVLDPSILTADASLDALVTLGESGERGELSVEGRVGPERDAFDVVIEARALELGLLRPYLGASPESGGLEGRLEGRVRVQPSGGLALRELRLGVAKLAFSGSERGAGPVLEDVELTVASVDLEGFGSAGRAFSGAEAQGLSLRATTPRGPLRLRSDRCVLDPGSEGAPARLTLDLKLGDDPSPGLLVVQAESAPIAAGGGLPPGPFRIEMSLESLDPEILLPYLPAEWQSGSRDAELAGSATWTGGAGQEVRGDARLDLRRGVLSISGAEIRDSSLAGVVRFGERGLRLDQGRFEAGRVSIGPHVGSGVRARVAWSGTVLDVAAIDLESYDGPLVLVGAEDVQLPVFHLTRAEGISGFGATGEWPLGGRSWLRMPSQVSVVDADGTIDDPRSPEAPGTVVRIEEAELRDFVAGGTAALALRARLGTPDRPQGRIEASGTWGPFGAEGAVLSGRVTVDGLDSQLALAYAPASWRVAGAPGPLDASLAVQATPGSRLVVDGSVLGATGSLAVRELQLDAPIAWRGKIVAERGEVEIEDGLLEASRVRVAGLEAQELRARHALEGTTLALPSVAWRAYAGSWAQVGSVTLADPLRFDLNLTVEGADVGRLIGAEVTEVPTLLRGDAALQGPWNGVDRWLEGVEGQGALELSGGTLPASQILRAIWSALRLRVPGVGESARSGQPSSRTRIQRARVPFRVARNRIRTDALEVVTDDYGLTGEARLSQGFDVRLNGDLQLTAQGISKLLRVGGIPEALRRGFRLPAIPIEARGPVRELSFRADVRNVPRATLSGLVGVPGRALDAAKGIGGVVGDMGRRAVGTGGEGDEADAR